MQNLSVLPTVPSTKLSVTNRAVGRLVTMQSPRPPANPVEGDLAGDVFHTLHSGVPKRDPVPAERMVNGHLLDWARSTAGFQETMKKCQGNIPASLAAGNLFWHNLCTDEAMSEAMKRQQEADEAKQKAEVEKAKADMQEQAGDPQAQRTRQRAEKLAEQAQGMQEALVERLQQMQGNPLNGAAVASAAQAADEKAGEVNSMLGGWGQGPGALTRTNPKEAEAFMRRMNLKVQQIAKLAGRFRGLGFEARNQRVVIGFDPTDLTFTQDVEKIFPSQLALMAPSAPEILRKITVIDYAEIGLMGWEFTGSTEESGAFAGACDVSGSMGGLRELIAKSVLLGTAQVAKAENRPYALFNFSSDHDPVIGCTSRDGWATHLDWAGASYGGGTSFDLALTRLMTELKQLPDGGKNADAVIASDGEGRIGQETRQKWLEFKQRTGARLLYIAVAQSHYQDIVELADKVVPVTDLDYSTGDSVAKAVASWIR